jgi:hypothetical protein
MKGDISRFTFNPLSNYLSVLKQQGRVDLDSDWNEQGEIFTEQIRQLISDFIGLFAVPLEPNDIANDNSQALAIDNFNYGPGGVIDFDIGRGIVYIGGYIFRLPGDITYSAQLDYPEPDMPPPGRDLIVYIEAWRRSICYIDDELIREPALGGPDTCLRSKLAGQVKILAADNINTPDEADKCIREILRPGNAALTLQIDQSAHQLPLSFGEVDLGGGMIPGNLHYRLELHRGIVGNGDISEGLKWSDENAATVARALRATDRKNIIVEELEQVSGESLKPGDWVEVSNVVTELHCQGGQMAMITGLESVSAGALVTLDRDIHPLLTRRKNGSRSTLDQGLGPRLRRWSGYITPIEPKIIYDLGRGVKALFSTADRKIVISPGDYWTFAIRDRDYNKHYAPQKAVPQGVTKYRYPLAIIKRREDGQAEKIIDCRRFLKPLAGSNFEK